MKFDNQNIDHDLLMAYILGEVAEEQRQKIDVWLQESDDNQAYFDKLEMLWIETGKLDPAPIDVVRPFYQRLRYGREAQGGGHWRPRSGGVVQGRGGSHRKVYQYQRDSFPGCGHLRQQNR